MIIRRLDLPDAEQYRLLRLSGLKNSPTAFGSSYAEEAKLTRAAFKARVQPDRNKQILGAFEGDRLVGIVTLIREGKVKARHKAGIFGMYVHPRFRKNGIGRHLFAATLQVARRMRGLRQVNLSVSESNHPARRLYESFGFKLYGREEAALRVGGKFYTELYQSLRL